jgi:hypothetical protein
MPGSRDAPSVNPADPLDGTSRIGLGTCGGNQARASASGRSAARERLEGARRHASPPEGNGGPAAGLPRPAARVGGVIGLRSLRARHLPCREAARADFRAHGQQLRGAQS